MARLNTNIQSDSDDEEFPDLSTILKSCTVKEMSEGSGGIEETNKNGEQGKKNMQHGVIYSPQNVRERFCDEKRLKKHRTLGIAHVNSLLLPIAKEIVQEKFNKDQYLDSRRDEKKSSPRRAVKACVDRTFSSLMTSSADFPDDVFFDDLSRFVVDDPARHVEEPSSRIQKSHGEVVPNADKVRSISKATVIDLTSPKKPSKMPSVETSNVKPSRERLEVSGTVFDENPEACLRLYALHHVSDCCC